MSETRHRYKVDNQEIHYEKEEQSKKRWTVVLNAVLKDKIENIEYLAHNKDELKKLENAEETDETISNLEEGQEQEDKPMKIIRIREEQYVETELMHRVRQAFTYGLRLDENHMPNRAKLRDNLIRTAIHG